MNKWTRLTLTIASIIVGTWLIMFALRVATWLINSLVAVAAVVIIGIVLYRTVIQKSTTSTKKPPLKVEREPSEENN